MTKVIDLSFYFFVSIISVYFYTRILPLKYTKGTAGLFIGGLIFISHLILFIPFWKTVFNIVQMAGEFFIIYFFTKGKAAAKLIAYVEMNISLGIGTVGANFILKAASLKSIAAYAKPAYIQRIIFYLVVLAITCMILAGVIVLKARIGKIIHIQGMEILVCMTLELLFFLYVTGMTMLEAKGERNIYVIAVFPIFIILVFIFLKISKCIGEKERLYM